MQQRSQCHCCTLFVRVYHVHDILILLADVTETQETWSVLWGGGPQTSGGGRWCVHPRTSFVHRSGFAASSVLGRPSFIARSITLLHEFKRQFKTYSSSATMTRVDACLDLV